MTHANVTPPLHTAVMAINIVDDVVLVVVVAVGVAIAVLVANMVCFTLA